jgi:hypothetical protein
MVKHIIYIFIIILLLANFCWEKKPLWKHFLPAAENAMENVVEGTEKSLKEGKEIIKEGTEKIKETIKDAPKAEISEEDREKLNEIIKKSSDKEKKKK